MKPWLVLVFIASIVLLNGVDVQARRVVVVGGGVAGVAAARRVLECDSTASVTVLEARDRLGGRIHTISPDEVPGWSSSSSSKGVELEAGAAWMHGSSSRHPITKLSNRLGLETADTDFDSSVIKRCTGSSVPANGCPTMRDRWDDSTRLLNKAKSSANNRNSDTSMWNALSGKRVNGLTRSHPAFLFNLASGFVFDNAARPHYVSAWEYNEDQEFSGSEAVLIDGYSQIPQALADGSVSIGGGSGSGRPLDVRTSSVVQLVERKGSKVHVTTTAGEKFIADAVVIAVPLGVLKKGSITFRPALPLQKRRAIAKTGFGNVVKIGLEFESRFWDANTEFFGLAHGTGDLSSAEFASYWLNFHGVTGRPVLQTYALGNKADEVEAWSDDRLWSAMRANLVELFGEAKVSSVPRPAVWRSAWRSDPFSGGAYSYPTVGFKYNQWGHLGKPTWGKRLQFAGEHTTGAYHSTVHGAFLTGVKAGNNVCKVSVRRSAGGGVRGGN